MIKALVAPLLVLALLACRPEPAEEAPLEANNAAEVAAEPPPDANINASLEPVVGPDAASPRFVGRWAPVERECSRTAWRFSETGLETPTGWVCRFTDVREVAGGYDIAARCTVEGAEHDDVLRLRFPPAGMLVESHSLTDAGLVRCRE